LILAVARNVVSDLAFYWARNIHVRTFALTISQRIRQLLSRTQPRNAFAFTCFVIHLIRIFARIKIWAFTLAVINIENLG